MTDAGKKWNKMLDLWVEELESPYAELTTYYNEVMKGGHYQYFDNVNNTGDLKKRNFYFNN